MIEIATLPTKPPETAPKSAISGGDPAQFAVALADFLKGAGAASPVGSDLPETTPGRQEIAATNKTASDDADDTVDPTSLWLPVTLPSPQPLPAPIARLNAALPGLAARIPAEGGILNVPVARAAGTAAPTVASAAAAEEAAASVPASDRPSFDISKLIPVEPKAVDSPPANDDAVRPVTGRVAASATPIVAAQPATPPAPIAQPAGQVFAAAILAAAGRNSRQTRDNDRTITAPTLTALNATVEVHRPIVQATADAKQAALDLRQDHGLQGMIDRIEILRDDADARDTRIRLIPDALGAVDVSVRKQGDALHVHFTAEAAATRTLLTDAQPRLAELAEARGVRIAQSSVDGGGSGAGRQAPQPMSYQTTAPVSAASLTEPEDTITDQRIA